MKKLLEFVSQHMADDTTRLILDKGKWPDIDMDTAVNCIESRRKLKGKVNEWYENPDFTGEKVVYQTPETTGNKVYYAKWKLVDLNYVTTIFNELVPEETTKNLSSPERHHRGIYCANSQNPFFVFLLIFYTKKFEKRCYLTKAENFCKIFDGVLTHLS